MATEMGLQAASKLRDPSRPHSSDQQSAAASSDDDSESGSFSSGSGSPPTGSSDRLSNDDEAAPLEARAAVPQHVIVDVLKGVGYKTTSVSLQQPAPERNDDFLNSLEGFTGGFFHYPTRRYLVVVKVCSKSLERLTSCTGSGNHHCFVPITPLAEHSGKVILDCACDPGSPGTRGTKGFNPFHSAHSVLLWRWKQPTTSTPEVVLLRESLSGRDYSLPLRDLAKYALAIFGVERIDSPDPAANPIISLDHDHACLMEGLEARAADCNMEPTADDDLESSDEDLTEMEE